MKTALIGAALAIVTAAGVTAVAMSTPDQYPGGNRRYEQQRAMSEVQGNTPYDGRFVFIRLRDRCGFGGFRSRGGPKWSHDYPRGEVHFTKILNEITYVRARMDGSNILSLEDPELFNFPIAYMAEPGDWSASDKEVENFRAYLKKGGFAIFDDFREQEGAWVNLQDQMRRVLPEARWIEIDDGQPPVRPSFFEIPDPMALEAHPVYAGMGLRPRYYGIFEDNNPAKRLIVI